MSASLNLGGAPPDDDAWGDVDTDLANMSRYPLFEYSNKEVKRAGKIISGDAPWTDEAEPAIRRAFQVANSWRDAHAFPMRSVRCSVQWYMRQSQIKGITAARLKRMPAIRKKLRRVDLNLNQLQDLAGCRAILHDITSVHELVRNIKEKMRHGLRHEDNYIEQPKDDGYRSHHLIFEFQAKGPDDAVFNKRRVELQVRTRLQHAWATCVEAVGLFRREELKNKQGSPEWLRLFALMSGEFAEVERCPVRSDIPAALERRAEIRKLAKALDAVLILESVRYAVKGTDAPIAPGYRPSHYLIRFDHASKTVFVVPYNGPRAATHSYDEAEDADNKSGQSTQNVVLVEVDKIENLKAAYPNYFGDVELFKNQLRHIAQGGAAVEYSSVPRQSGPPASKYGDLSWLRRAQFPRPDSGLGKKKR